jgi:hypothetical protein
MQIGVAHASSANVYPHLTGTGLGKLHLGEIDTGSIENYSLHVCDLF